MSAVSSVMTPGVLVTVIPRRSALVTSMWSTPLPKFAMSFICSPAWAIIAALIWSVMVGTRTSASRIASTISACDSGLSSRLRRASNNSRMRVSTSSGSRRVTTTRGFFLVMSAALSALAASPPPPRLQPFASTLSSSLRLVNIARRKCFCAGVWPTARGPPARRPLYQKAGQRQGSAWPSPRSLAMERDQRPIQAAGLTRRVSLAILCVLALAPELATADPVGSVTKLPLPRFASLKTDRVNLREGPSKDHATKWVYQRAGLPVEITAEFEVWRRVRDSEGVEGWVLHSLLSGTSHRSGDAEQKGESSKIFARPSGERRPRGDPPVRRHRQHSQLRRRMVPGRRRRIQGLYPAGQALGRLPRTRRSNEAVRSPKRKGQPERRVFD